MVESIDSKWYFGQVTKPLAGFALAGPRAKRTQRRHLRANQPGINAEYHDHISQAIHNHCTSGHIISVHCR